MNRVKKFLKNQYGFGSQIIILVVLVFASVGVVGYRIYQGRQKPAETVTNNASDSSSNQATEAQQPVDPTADWKSYTNKVGKYTLKYPAGWYKDVCDESLTDLALYLGPTKSSRVICNSEHISQIVIISTPSVPTASEQSLGTNYTNITEKKVVVDGVTGNRQSGKLKVAEFGAPAGTLIVRYFFLAKGRTYIASYIQTPSGDYRADNLDNFDLIITKTLNFTK